MGDWLLSILWYASFLIAMVALLALVRPIRWLRLPTRRRSLITLGIAVALIGMNATVLPSATRVVAPRSALDGLAPAYHFREYHERTVDAPPARVIAAARAVTASEIRLFQAFTTIRRFGRAAPESILNAPETLPLLDVATRSGFVSLADAPDELVVGAIVAAPRHVRPRLRSMDAAWFLAVQEAGVVKAMMNFRVEAIDGARSRLTTETRVTGTDASGVRRFTPYWRTIFPGSWILRVTWLNAIAERAEAQPLPVAFGTSVRLSHRRVCDPIPDSVLSRRPD